MDTLGHLLALHVTPASRRDDHAEVGRLAAAIQDTTDERVELAYVDQAIRRRETCRGSTGPRDYP